MRMYPVLVGVLAVALSWSVSWAKDTPLQLDAVRNQQAEIRDGVIARTGPYKDIPEDKRDVLLDKQRFVLRTIEGKQTSDELSQNERMELFNALEWIEAVVNNAEDERMVCKLEKSTGSNRHVRVCKTVAQMRAEKEDARRKMMQAQRCGGLTCVSN